MRHRHLIHRFRYLAIGLLLVFLPLGCGQGPDSRQPAEDRPEFVVGAIPDQNISQLNRRFNLFVDYLENETGLQVEYNQSNSYAALVTAFKRGEVHLGWFGGLTGVQARAAVEGSRAIAQRPRDENFHSKFIRATGTEIDTLDDLKGHTFTFGSESSTSGHLMPRYFLRQAGIKPEENFASAPNYSGSHDKTWKLVESGAYDAGALNELVWARAVRENQVDTSRVKVFYTTPSYHDYNWTIHGQVDQIFGADTTRKVKDSLLNMEEDQQEILDLFSTEKFISTRNENYSKIREVAEDLGIIKS